MLKKILFTLSVLAFVIGSSNIGEAPQWDAGLPLGAVFFILFMIVTLLEKETALYDEQQQNSEKSKTPQVDDVATRGLKSPDTRLSPIGKAA